MNFNSEVLMTLMRPIAILYTTENSGDVYGVGLFKSNNVLRCFVCVLRPFNSQVI